MQPRLRPGEDPGDGPQRLHAPRPALLGAGPWVGVGLLLMGRAVVCNFQLNEWRGWGWGVRPSFLLCTRPPPHHPPTPTNVGRAQLLLRRRRTEVGDKPRVAPDGGPVVLAANVGEPLHHRAPLLGGVHGRLEGLGQHARGVEVEGRLGHSAVPEVLRDHLPLLRDAEAPVQRVGGHADEGLLSFFGGGGGGVDGAGARVGNSG